VRRLTGGALLDAVRGVHWPGRRVTRGALHGAHRSKRVGSSPEFREYRAYQQGDDPAKIDWKLFGRTERVAIRLAHDDASLRTSVLVDASASMAFPPATLDKWERAASVAPGVGGGGQQFRGGRCCGDADAGRGGGGASRAEGGSGA
jgi:uncharacterized protein (DUF58 family)